MCPWPRSGLPAAPGSRRHCRRWQPGGRKASGSRLWQRRLGVSKGGFYWHFKDRGALLEEMLDSWEQSVVGDIIAQVEGEPGEPRAKLQHLFELASTPPPTCCRSSWHCGTGRGATAKSPRGCTESTTSAWNTCARCSGRSAPTRTTSRHAACSPSRSSSAATSSLPSTGAGADHRSCSSRSSACSPSRWG